MLRNGFPLLLLLATGAVAQPPTPTAEQAVKAALDQARREHKNVLLDFSASWCPWCVQFEKLYADPKFGPLFRKGYVIAPITVREIPAKRTDENVGWEKVMTRYRKVKDQDIPYLVILSPRGHKLADSYEPAGQTIPGNAGFPQTPAEIDAFVKLIKSTSRSFTAKDLEDLRAYFLNVRAHAHHHG